MSVHPSKSQIFATYWLISITKQIAIRKLKFTELACILTIDLQVTMYRSYILTLALIIMLWFLGLYGPNESPKLSYLQLHCAIL